VLDQNGWQHGPNEISFTKLQTPKNALLHYRKGQSFLIFLFLLSWSFMETICLFSFFYFCYHGASWRPFVFSHFSIVVIMEGHGDHLSMKQGSLYCQVEISQSVLEFGGCSWWFWKALGESDLIEFISQFSELMCGRYWFFSGFCCWKFKKIYKNWVWKEKSVEPTEWATLVPIMLKLVPVM
jgi:hypothetical protein